MCRLVIAIAKYLKNSLKEEKCIFHFWFKMFQSMVHLFCVSESILRHYIIAGNRSMWQRLFNSGEASLEEGRENAERRIGQNALQGPLSSIRVPPSTVSEPQKRASKVETQQWIEPVRKIVNSRSNNLPDALHLVTESKDKSLWGAGISIARSECYQRKQKVEMRHHGISTARDGQKRTHQYEERSLKSRRVETQTALQL